MNQSTSPVRPPLKWAGGKRWLTGNYAGLFPKEYQKYYEPFLGGGAVFFHLQPKKARLSDINSDLINTYKALRDDWKGVELALQSHSDSHTTDYFYQARSSKPTGDIARAAWFLYMNRACYNGLYRVNQKGVFNVPKGTKDTIVFPNDKFSLISETLQGVELEVDDFEASVDSAQEGDFVYLDPPYTVRHNNNGFIKYNEVMFSWSDQERLVLSVERAANRGAKILVSNADHSSVVDLYTHLGETVSLDRYSVIGGGNGYRSKTSEIAVRIGY